MGKLVVVSGGFDPIHKGHIKLLKAARALGDELAVILNNDNWLKSKKGYTFMPEQDRVTILLALRVVDAVYLTQHDEDDLDVSVCEAIKQIKPDIFANGGDRVEDNVPEVVLCNELGIELVFNVGGEKIASSSDLVAWSKEKLL